MLRFHLTFVFAINKKTRNCECWIGYGGKGTLSIDSGSENLFSQYGNSFKKLSIEIYDSALPFLCMKSKEQKSKYNNGLCMPVSIIILLIIFKTQFRCPLTDM